MLDSDETSKEHRSVSRRRFLKNVALGGAAGGIGLALGDSALPTVDAPTPSDVQESAYIVYIDAGTVKVRNGTTGVVDFSGTAAAAIQWAMDQITTGSGGRLSIRRGTYPLGATSLSVKIPLPFDPTKPVDLWEIICERGAKLTYSGGDFAMKINAEVNGNSVRGHIRRFRLINLHIESSGISGGCLQIRGGYLFRLHDCILDCTGNGPVTCLDLDDLNSGRVTGGHIKGPFTWDPDTRIPKTGVGSIGIRLAHSKGDVKQLMLRPELIAGCDIGIKIGTPPTSLTHPTAALIKISSELASNGFGIYANLGNRIEIYRCWFENQLNDTIVVDNNGLFMTPSGWDISYNDFNEPSANPLRVTGYLYYLRTKGNGWGAGKVILTPNTAFGDLDLSTVTKDNLVMGGAVPASFLLDKSLGVMTKAGIPVDADFTNPQDGLLVIDTSHDRIYVRTRGVWKGVDVTVLPP